MGWAGCGQAGYLLKIATFNVIKDSNLQRQRRQWSATGAPALACRIQARCRMPSGVEGAQQKFLEAAIREAGYGAVLARPEELEWRRHSRARSGAGRESSRLAGDPEDTHSRYLEALVDDVLVGCLYLPNGNPALGPKFD